ncbi:MAG: hypothetical protein ACK5HP_00440 [Bacilli bacterium]
MKNFEKYIVIKTMSELLAYELYYYYKIDKPTYDNVEPIYNTVHCQIPHKEIMELGTIMAKVLYDVPIK